MNRFINLKIRLVCYFCKNTYFYMRFPRIFLFETEENQNDFQKKHVYTCFGHLFFLALIVYSWFFYLERTLPFDGAFYSFKIIHFGKINIESGRWGAVYNQFLPLLGLKWGCSLDGFLRLYSVSFALCNYIFYLLIQHVLFKPRIALAFVISQIIAYRFNFFYPVSEIHASVGPLFIFLALLYSSDFAFNRKGLIYAFLLVICTYWIAGIHLLALLVWAYFLGFYLLTRLEMLKKPVFILSALLGVLFFVLVVKSIQAGSYQASRMLGIKEILLVWKDRNAVAGFLFFKDAFFKNYLFLFGMTSLMVIFYGFRKQWLKLLYILTSFGGLWVIIMASNIHVDSPIVYQNYYALFGLFFSAPFFVEVLPTFRFKYAFPILLLVFLVSASKIAKAGIFYREQIDYFDRTITNLRAYPERKFVVDEANIDFKKLWVDWDVSFQSLIISSLQHPDYSMSFYTTAKPNEYDSLLADKNTLIGVDFEPFWFHADQLNSQFFRLGATPYRKVNTNQDAYPAEKVINPKFIDLICQSEYSLFRADFRTLVVSIQNRMEDTLFSKPGLNRSFMLTYQLYNAKGRFLKKGIESPLELDVLPHSSIQTGVVLQCGDLARGKYWIEFSFLQNGLRVGEKKKSELFLY